MIGRRLLESDWYTLLPSPCRPAILKAGGLFTQELQV